MIFAIWYNGAFVNFWLNSPNDNGWIERTVAAMNWNPLNVVVLQFFEDFMALESFSWDADKKAVPIIKSQVEVDGVMTDIFTPDNDNKITGLTWFENGVRVQAYQ